MLEAKDGGKRFGYVGQHAEFWDWDNDGDLDLISSDLYQGVVLYTNEGSSKEPVFESPSNHPLKAGDAVLGLDEAAGIADAKQIQTLSKLYMSHAQPLMHDWDSDGLADLMLAGSTNGKDQRIVWCRNTGKLGAPKFAEPETLVAIDASSEKSSSTFWLAKDGEYRALDGYLRFTVADINGDGLEDLVVGDSCKKTVLRASVVASNDDVMQLLKKVEQLEIKLKSTVANSSNDSSKEESNEESDGGAPTGPPPIFHTPDDELVEEYFDTVEELKKAYSKAAPKGEGVAPVGMVWVLERQ